jgi:hypothetical protein
MILFGEGCAQGPPRGSRRLVRHSSDRVERGLDGNHLGCRKQGINGISLTGVSCRNYEICEARRKTCCNREAARTD